MKTRIPAYYPDFHCIAGDCPDTCCAGWEIDLDEAAYRRYQALPGEFGQTVRAALGGEEGSRSICRTPDGHCAFLREDGLCTLVLRLGEEALGEVCHMHPRFLTSYGSRRELCLSLSCPEAARLILSQTAPLTFTELESDDPVEPNDLDPELYLELRACRETAFALAQDRSRSVGARAALLLRFARKIQKAIDGGKLHRLARVRAHYGDAAWTSQKLAAISAHPNPGSALSAMCLDLGMLEYAAPDLPKLLGAASLQPDRLPDAPADMEIALEQLLVYYIFRYFLPACFDGALLPKMQLAALGLLTLRTLWLTDLRPNPEQDNARRAWLAHYFAREIEHNDENLARLDEVFRTEKRYRAKALSSLLRCF